MNPIASLLTDSSVILRLRVMQELLDDPDPDEVRWLEDRVDNDPIVLTLLQLQQDDGAWSEPPTEWALLRLGTLGAGTTRRGRRAIDRGAEYLLRHQQADGSWPIRKPNLDDAGEQRGYDKVPLQTALPLIGLGAAGLAESPEAERGYEWLLENRLSDGTWPTGTAGGTNGFVAGYRRLPHSRWGCRSNTTGAVLAISFHPELRTTDAARTGLDHLLARETRDRSLLGFESARVLGFTPVRGFFTRFARFDPALLLELAVATGVGRTDDRVDDLADWVEAQRSDSGQWEYLADPNASAWVSFRLMRTLRLLGAEESKWTGAQPRTPFVAYTRSRRRF